MAKQGSTFPRTNPSNKWVAAYWANPYPTEEEQRRYYEETSDGQREAAEAQAYKMEREEGTRRLYASPEFQRRSAEYEATPKKRTTKRR